MKQRNVFRELLNEGKPTIGTHVQAMWPGYVEIIGHTGVFDYIEFFGTDAAYNLFTLDEIGVALDHFDHLAGMIKLPQELRTYMTERAIGSGMQSVIYADVRTGEDARNVVAAVRAETPGGGTVTPMISSPGSSTLSFHGVSPGRR